jgi:hypothetical protein
VCADVTLAADTDPAAMRLKIKQHCATKLQPFMVPVRINFPTESLHTTRMKRRRTRP